MASIGQEETFDDYLKSIEVEEENAWSEEAEADLNYSEIVIERHNKE